MDRAAVLLRSSEVRRPPGESEGERMQPESSSSSRCARACVRACVYAQVSEQLQSVADQLR